MTARAIRASNGRHGCAGDVTGMVDVVRADYAASAGS